MSDEESVDIDQEDTGNRRRRSKPVFYGGISVTAVVLVVGGALLNQVFIENPKVYAEKPAIVEVKQEIEKVDGKVEALRKEAVETLSSIKDNIADQFTLIRKDIADSLQDTKVNESRIAALDKELERHETRGH